MTSTSPASRRVSFPLAAAAIAAVVVFVQPAAQAQPVAPADDAAPQWGLGIAAGQERSAYRGFDNKLRGLPIVTYENRWISLQGPSLDLKLPSAGPVSFRLRARYSDEGYEASDSPFLAGMAERKDGIWLGGAAIWRTDVARLSAELLGDASGNSKGNKFRVMVDRRFQAGAFDFTPRFAVTRLDEKYVSYYYGVKTSEALPNRRAYQGSSAVNMELGLRTGYTLTPQQSIFLDLSTTNLGSSIKDSPLVDRSSQSGVRVGYLYRF